MRPRVRASMTTLFLSFPIYLIIISRQLFYVSILCRPKGWRHPAKTSNRLWWHHGGFIQTNEVSFLISPSSHRSFHRFWWHESDSRDYNSSRRATCPSPSNAVDLKWSYGLAAGVCCVHRLGRMKLCDQLARICRIFRWSSLCSASLSLSPCICRVLP